MITDEAQFRPHNLPYQLQYRSLDLRLLQNLTWNGLQH